MQTFVSTALISALGVALLVQCGRPNYNASTGSGGSGTTTTGGNNSTGGLGSGAANPAGGSISSGGSSGGMAGTINTMGGVPNECMAFTVPRTVVMPDPATNPPVVEKVNSLTAEQRLRLMYGYPNCSYASGDQCFQQQAMPEASVPKWSMRDGPRGVRTMGSFPSTSFPCAMARAASFDLALEQEIGALVAEEMLGFKWDLMLAPTINILRHPGWGRAQETYGEDPVLLGEMGAAYVRGIQGGGIPACIKHFAANNTEDNRTTVSSNMDMQTLRENYTRQFEIAVMKSDPACFMAAYNKVNGTYSAENSVLLTDILRTEWQWKGMVLSDWGATKSTVASANAGLDLEMPDSAFFGSLSQYVPGQVSAERIVQAVQRNFNVRYTFNQMSQDYQNRPQNTAIVDAQTHRDAALKAAREGMVLLRNTDNILPLAAGANILVVGPDATVARLGDQGSSEVHPKAEYVVTPLAGIEAAAGAAGATVQHVGDLNGAVAAAAGKTAVILVVSMAHQDEGEGFNQGGDRDNLGLAGPHPLEAAWSPKPASWITQLAAANPNLIVVLNIGGAVVEPTLDSAKGLIHSFYPGQAGGTALGELLFGAQNFSAKLPFTVATDAAHYPAFGNSGDVASYDYLHGYRKFDGEGLTPKHYFGAGLSYTTYSYANLRVPCTNGITSNGLLIAEVDVTNSGTKPGTEIVMLFVGYPNAATSGVRRPRKELKAFTRVALNPGETKTVQLTVPAQDLRYFNEASGWTIDPGMHELLVGPSADPATLLSAMFTVN